MLQQTVIIASLIHRYEFVLEQPNAEVPFWHPGLNQPEADGYTHLAQNQRRLHPQTLCVQGRHQEEGGLDMITMNLSKYVLFSL